MISLRLAEDKIERIMDWQVIDIHIHTPEVVQRMDFNPTRNMVRIYTTNEAAEKPTVKLFERDKIDEAYQYYMGFFDKHRDSKMQT